MSGRRRWLRWMAVAPMVGVALFVVAACGGDDDEGGGSEAGAGPAQQWEGTYDSNFGELSLTRPER